MNKTKKYTLALLGFFTTFLSACSQYGDPYKDVPKEINGHPVYEVPFEQPLNIDPKKEQVFYFKLKKKPKALETNYAVYIMAMFPFEDKKYYDIEKGVDMNDYLIENKLLNFETSLTHLDKNQKETQISLSNNFIHYAELPKINNNYENAIRFKNNQTQFVADENTALSSRTFNGEEFSIRKNAMAWFLIQEKGGYYRLKIRPLQKFPNYPKLRLSVSVNTQPYHK